MQWSYYCFSDIVATILFAVSGLVLFRLLCSSLQTDCCVPLTTLWIYSTSYIWLSEPLLNFLLYFLLTPPHASHPHPHPTLLRPCRCFAFCFHLVIIWTGCWNCLQYLYQHPLLNITSLGWWLVIFSFLTCTVIMEDFLPCLGSLAGVLLVAMTLVFGIVVHSNTILVFSVLIYLAPDVCHCVCVCTCMYFCISISMFRILLHKERWKGMKLNGFLERK